MIIAAERNTLLVPVDFTDVSDFAIDHAVEIARIFHHKICLLHVSAKRSRGTDKDIMLLEELESKAHAMARRTGLDVQFRIEEGNIPAVISQEADRLNAEFVVMGIHGKKGSQQIAGNHAYKVACSSPVPVMVVKHMHHHSGYRNIVVPVDFAQERTQKIKQAIRFARYFDARIRVFGFLSSENKARIIKKEALLKSVTDVFKARHIPVTTDLLIRRGYDWDDALLDYTTDIGADLIMMVAEKGRGLTDMFSSNMTERIIDRAEVPVLTVASCEDHPESHWQQKAMVQPFLDPLGLIREDPGLPDFNQI